MSSPDLRWILSHHLAVFPGGACVHQTRRRMERIVLAVFWTGAPVGSQGRIFGTSPLVSVPPLDRPARTEGMDGPHPSLGLPIASLGRDPCARVEHGLSLVTFSLGFVPVPPPCCPWTGRDRPPSPPFPGGARRERVGDSRGEPVSSFEPSRRGWDAPVCPSMGTRDGPGLSRDSMPVQKGPCPWASPDPDPKGQKCSTNAPTCFRETDLDRREARGRRSEQ